MDQCWNLIGIKGDRTCSELTEMVHCRNCPVYSTGGRSLLERDLPQDYQQEWTERLKEEISGRSLLALSGSEPQTKTQTARDITVMIFRIQTEWFALSTHCVKEVTSPVIVRTLPYCDKNFLKGLVNIRGELLPCISLSNVLNIEANSTSAKTMSSIIYQRLVVLEECRDRSWVFQADEVFGVEHVPFTSLQSPPVNASTSQQTLTNQLFDWRNARVGLLNETQLFQTLNRRLLHQ